MITDELLKKLSTLAHLGDESREIEGLKGDLGAIFQYMALLEKADVGALQPMTHVLPQVNVVRPDVPEEPLPLEGLLDNAPDAHGRFIRVPLIVESGEH